MDIRISSSEIDTLTARAIDHGDVVMIEINNDVSIFLHAAQILLLLDQLQNAIKDLKWYECVDSEDDPIARRLVAMGAKP